MLKPPFGAALIVKLSIVCRIYRKKKAALPAPGDLKNNELIGELSDPTIKTREEIKNNNGRTID